MSTSEAELANKIIHWVQAHMQPGVPDGVEITAETDLLEGGLLDSLGLVDLILFIDGQDGCNVDLTDVEPSEFSLVSGLCRIALRNGR